jgi:hypothetical protein
MMVSLTWAGVVLIRQRRNIDAGGFAEPES